MEAPLRPTEWVEYDQLIGRNWAPVVGRLLVRFDVVGPESGDRREIFVLLPPGYDESDQSYPVVYMNDGQNLFDPALSYVGSWRVDRTLEELSREGREAIVVGVPNMGTRRLDEYSPFVDSHHGGGRGEAYLDFVIERVKPIIDAEFRTRLDADSTGIVGSSMGGLISLYAFYRRPDVFGFAGVMSPSLHFASEAIFGWLRRQEASEGRLFVSMGTHEAMGNGIRRWFSTRRNVRQVARLKKLLRRRGMIDRDRYREEIVKGGRHNEAAWSTLMPDALRFLLPGS